MARRIRGHRRTVSSTEAEMQFHMRGSLDEQQSNQDLLAQLSNTTKLGSSICSEGNINLLTEAFPPLQQLIEASSQLAGEKTTIIEDLNHKAAHEDPLFQFGKNKKSQAGAAKNSLKDQTTTLFMIPQLLRCHKYPAIEQSKSSRVTQATEKTKNIEGRTNNLMNRVSLTPTQSKNRCTLVFGRLKAERREAAKQRQAILRNKVRQRLSNIAYKFF